MSETFRPAREEEIPEIARVMGHSFVGRTQEQLETLLREGPYSGVEALWVGEEEGRVVAACDLHSMQQWIGGARYPMMGLGSVAVSPVHRRRGLAGRLVTSGLRVARERGDLVSALYPFRIAFYARLGYGLAGEAHQYQLPPETVPDAPERRRLRSVSSEEDRATLRRVYDRWAQGENGQLERGDGVWRRMWEDEARAGVVYWGEAGEAEGYAVVRYRADLPPQERFLEVEERAWLTPAAQRGIYGWLASLGDQWHSLLYRAHPEEGFANHLSEERLPLGREPHWGLWFPAATLMRGPMFRLLNVSGAFAARRVAAEAALDLALEVEDEQLPENRGPWRLRLEGKRCEVEAGSAGAGEATLRLQVTTLSRIFIGDLAPSAAVATGRATLDRPELLPALDSALRLRRPWTFDRF
ncbi:MAG: GNAT family N-acetyltransferase [Longimicrobiaceae bacterium]